MLKNDSRYALLPHTALTGAIANACHTEAQTSFNVSANGTSIGNWWRMTGSNRRPPACKAGALPAELIPRRSASRGFTHLTADNVVGLVGFEPTTPALSRRCSNRLSYRPLKACLQTTADKCERSTLRRLSSGKEVIQPHLPIRLPCYDFTPVMNPTVVTVLLAVRLATSGKTHSHGVTGGVYKTRERIHRGMLIRDY